MDLQQVQDSLRSLGITDDVSSMDEECTGLVTVQDYAQWWGENEDTRQQLFNIVRAQITQQQQLQKQRQEQQQRQQPLYASAAKQAAFELDSALESLQAVESHGETMTTMETMIS